MDDSKVFMFPDSNKSNIDPALLMTMMNDSKDAMSSYTSAALQNSRNIVEGYEKHQKLIPLYEGILEELNPSLRADKEKDRAIQSLKDEVLELKQMLINMAKVGDTKN